MWNLLRGMKIARHEKRSCQKGKGSKVMLIVEGTGQSIITEYQLLNVIRK